MRAFALGILVGAVLLALWAIGDDRTEYGRW